MYTYICRCTHQSIHPYIHTCVRTYICRYTRVYLYILAGSSCATWQLCFCCTILLSNELTWRFGAWTDTNLKQNSEATSSLKHYSFLPRMNNSCNITGRVVKRGIEQPHDTKAPRILNAKRNPSARSQQKC